MTYDLTISVRTMCVMLLGCGLGLVAGPAACDQGSFIDQMNMSMMKMDSAMQIQSSGDVDRDFVAMMEPHHRGAIDMARLELQHGHNEQLRRIAQEIIVDQEQEIVAMQRAIHPLSSVEHP